jgi:hypothetical protein
MTGKNQRRREVCTSLDTWNEEMSMTQHPDGPNYQADDPGPIGELAERIHRNAVEHGFWPAEGRNFGEMIALIHSEASEALEEHRAGNRAFYMVPQTYGPDKPEGVMVELWDVIIRCLDTMQEIAEREGIKIDDVGEAKLTFNESRPHKHGKKY